MFLLCILNVITVYTNLLWMRDSCQRVRLRVYVCAYSVLTLYYISFILWSYIKKSIKFCRLVRITLGHINIVYVTRVYEEMTATMVFQIVSYVCSAATWNTRTCVHCPFLLMRGLNVYPERECAPFVSDAFTRRRLGCTVKQVCLQNIILFRSVYECTTFTCVFT